MRLRCLSGGEILWCLHRENKEGAFGVINLNAPYFGGVPTAD